jgi:Family of unknown function (DUF6093)
VVRKTHKGRVGYRVIPRDYGGRIADSANQTHTAECEIYGPEVLGAFNPLTGAYDVTPGPLRYQGFCRVQRRNQQTVAGIVTEQELPAMVYEVAIDKDTDTVQTRDIVTVTACVEDPQLVGQELAVRGVVKGSMRSERILFCIDDLST